MPGAIPEKADRSIYSCARYQFFLEAPFEISHMCCHAMKKSPMHKYAKDTGRHPITAQMASESRLRTQKWLANGCNGFDLKEPISNPMSFWFDEDVLLYAKQHDIKLAPVYGDIVTEDGEQLEGQMDLSSFGIFDLERPALKTTGCTRTGCFGCLFGAHRDKPTSKRFDDIINFSNPKLADWLLRGGDFEEETGLWKPGRTGMGYWFILEWCNVHGNMKYVYPNREYYIEKYGNELTRKYLSKE